MLASAVARLRTSATSPVVTNTIAAPLSVSSTVTEVPATRSGHVGSLSIWRGADGFSGGAVAAGLHATSAATSAMYFTTLVSRRTIANSNGCVAGGLDGGRQLRERD